MKYWFGVVCLFVAAAAGYAGLWTALPLGLIGLYFLVSNWQEKGETG